MKSFLELKEKIQKGKDDPCWKDYVQLGTKKKNGKEVPNCVPKESAVQEESTELDETITPKHVKMAIGVASDKRYAGGNMTGAVNAIEKIKKGLSDHPQVKAVLRKQNESLDEAGSPERLAMIKRATQRVKDKRDAARAAEKKTSFKAAARDMQTKGAQRGMAPLKREIDEGHDDAQKAFVGLVKRGGIDKVTFQKAHDLYSNAKFSELKKLISGADTDPREAILDVINRHDRKTFNSMYPRGLSKGGLTKESVELGEAKISVGDRVTLQPNKNTLDRSLIGKAGVVTGMVGSKPTVKFANGKTIVASPNDLKINESVEVDEAAPKLKGNSGPWSKADLAKAMKIAKVDIAVAARITKALRESFELSEVSKEGTIRIIDLGNRKQDSIRKELGVDGLPNKGFQVQSMTKGKFVNLGKPYKDLKGAEEFKRTRQHSMQFEGLDESKSKKYYNDLMKSALKKAGRKMDPDLTSSFATNGDFIVSDRGVVVARLKKGTYPTIKESVEHEDCGTPDCCGTCDTDIKEMNFFQFRNRLDRTRD